MTRFLMSCSFRPRSGSLTACRFIFPPPNNKRLVDAFSLEGVPESKLSLFPSLAVGEAFPIPDQAALRDRGYPRDVLKTHYLPAMRLARQIMR